MTMTMHPLPFPVDPTAGRVASSIRARFVPGPIPGSPAWNVRTGFDHAHPGIRRGGIAAAVQNHARARMMHPLPHPNPVEVGA